MQSRSLVESLTSFIFFFFIITRKILESKGHAQFYASFTDINTYKHEKTTRNEKLSISFSFVYSLTLITRL